MKINFFRYNGVQAQQVKWVDKVFEYIFQREQFDIVIEIGTWYGALSQLLEHMGTVYGFKFVSMDIENRFSDIGHIKKPSFEFVQMDCFENNGSYITDLIKTHQRVLLLCDGGNKNKEFKFFARRLKLNDMIMTHDYSTSTEYFDKYIKGRIWNRCCDTDESLGFEEYGVEKIHTDVTSRAVWGCFIKKEIV